MSETTPKRSRRSITGAALLGSAALLAGVGAFAAFTDTESVTRSVAAGQLDIEVDGTFAVEGMAPGDIHSQLLTVELPEDHNDGDLIEFIRFETAMGAEVLGQHMDNGVQGPDGSASLFTDEAGLRVVIQNCEDGVWTEVGDGTFTCDGTVVDVIGDVGGAITGTADIDHAEKVDDFGIDTELGAVDFGVDETATGTIPDGSSLNLLVTLALPGDDNQFGGNLAAGNAFENASGDIEFTLTAIQRGGIEK